MSVTIDQFVALADSLMNPAAFSDYCPNGLQVRGRSTVQKLVCGVTANQALIDAAAAAGADVLLVHHGFFWKGEDPCLTGIKYRRIKRLIDHDINLVAYHLPLDAHPELGNNARLAALLGIEVGGGLEPGNPLSVGNTGRLSAPMAAGEFCARVATVLDREPLLVAAGDRPIETVAWCTGAAQGYIDRAAVLGVDAYLSGEISEPTVHSARELGVHYIAAGHHATERYGVQALGQHLASELGLAYEFIDINSPV